MSDNFLYIVATPIGNLADISHRAVQVLQTCDVIVCEDTRHSGKLLRHIGVTGKSVMAYHDHSGEKERRKILSLITEGNSIALISDAGTPLISDPGYRLVREAIAAGVRIVPIPGACGAITALSASGLPTDKFHFMGFAPHKKRDAFVKSLMGMGGGTVIFYESPERLGDMLQRLTAVIPQSQAVIARELTKLYEEILRGSVEELHEIIKARGKVKGEITVLLSVGEAVTATADDDIKSLLAVLLPSVPLREAVDKVTAATGQPRNRIYDLALQVKNGEDS